MGFEIMDLLLWSVGTEAVGNEVQCNGSAPVVHGGVHFQYSSMGGSVWRDSITTYTLLNRDFWVEEAIGEGRDPWTCLREGGID